MVDFYAMNNRIGQRITSECLQLPAVLFSYLIRSVAQSVNKDCTFSKIVSHILRYHLISFIIWLYSVYVHLLSPFYVVTIQITWSIVNRLTSFLTLCYLALHITQIAEGAQTITSEHLFRLVDRSLLSHTPPQTFFPSLLRWISAFPPFFHPKFTQTPSFHFFSFAFHSLLLRLI